MSECHRNVPIVLVVTKKDEFIKMKYGDRMYDESVDTSKAEAKQWAQQELKRRTEDIKAEIEGLEGGRVDACVEVEKGKSLLSGDRTTICELTVLTCS